MNQNVNIMLNPEVLGTEIKEIQELLANSIDLVNNTKTEINTLTTQAGGLSGPEGTKLNETYNQKATKMSNDLEEFGKEYISALSNAANNLINASETNAGNIQG